MAKRKRKPTAPLTLDEALASQPAAKPRPEDGPFLILVDQLVSMEEDFENQERERARLEADALVELEKLAVQFAAKEKIELERRAKAREVRLARQAAEKAAKEAESGSRSKKPVQIAS